MKCGQIMSFLLLLLAIDKKTRSVAIVLSLGFIYNPFSIGGFSPSCAHNGPWGMNKHASFSCQNFEPSKREKYPDRWRSKRQLRFLRVIGSLCSNNGFAITVNKHIFLVTIELDHTPPPVPINGQDFITMKRWRELLYHCICKLFLMVTHFEVKISKIKTKKYTSSN